MPVILALSSNADAVVSQWYPDAPMPTAVSLATTAIYDSAGFAYDEPVDNAHGPDFGRAAIDTRGSSDRSSVASGSGRSGYIYDPARSLVAPRTPGGAGPVRVGQEGLDALGVTQNTTRIPRPSGTGYRVPDILDEAGGVLGEVKNVQSLSYTQQLRDYAWYAQQNGYQFDLYVRGSTTLSGPLQTAVDNGVINLHRALPG